MAIGWPRLIGFGRRPESIPVDGEGWLSASLRAGRRLVGSGVRAARSLWQQVSAGLPARTDKAQDNDRGVVWQEAQVTEVSAVETTVETVPAEVQASLAVMAEPAADEGVTLRDAEPEEEDSREEDAAVETQAESASEEGDEEVATGGRDRLDSMLESLLLAAGAPLQVRRMVQVLGGPKSKEVRAALKRLMAEYSGPERGIHLVEVAGGYQFRTSPDNVKPVRLLLREKPARLGRAALETLSIIAYKQPVTRGEIEAVRGVDADSALHTLQAKRLIKIEGRKEAVGRPLLYATTPEFLEIFGLKDLRELPTLKEIGPVPEPDNETDIEEEGVATGDIEAAAGESGEDGTGPEDEHQAFAAAPQEGLLEAAEESIEEDAAADGEDGEAEAQSAGDPWQETDDEPGF